MSYQDLINLQAHATRKKREDIIERNIPYLCKKCNQEKFPDEFVMHYMDNPIAGKYRYLYECKQCKKDRIYAQRGVSRETLDSAIDVIYKQLQWGAKQRRLEFNIKLSDVIKLWGDQGGKCYYTGYEMTYEFIHYKTGKQNNKTAYQVSCDRLDSELGYTKDNIVLCCTMVNKMKNTMSEEEFYKVCNDIIRHRRG